MTDEKLDAARRTEHEARRFQNMAALGLFVTEFETLVDRLRASSQALITGDTKRFVNIILRHHALTANPLFEINRALMSEWINKWASNISEQDKKTIKKTIKHLAKRIKSLVEERNKLLHSSWYSNSSDHEDHFGVSRSVKGKFESEGFRYAEEDYDWNSLAALSIECQKVRFLHETISTCLTYLINSHDKSPIMHLNLQIESEPHYVIGHPYSINTPTSQIFQEKYIVSPDLTPDPSLKPNQ